MVGEVRQAGGQESVVHAGQEVGGVQAVGFESAQVIGDLPGGDRTGWQSAQLAGERAQIGVGEAVGVAAKC
ncbi:hypothetical protein [Candidatus Mycobacterium methanotrophicum]|uniref:Uncharacterized protein n=1 Tax=Candidatus Mycobacterium methanotrophicum TaxID=2943498 RepID=A0ABY4QIN9_9MYCO|nr:hypothetical protein [Candidatus Mycobacterium methanotrophicum]UQX10367.1 hypothetical protein M5I08_19920 [Candidatus Mycobacterium methanotrophicum]